MRSISAARRRGGGGMVLFFCRASPSNLRKEQGRKRWKPAARARARAA